jgi:hypothetical protein
MDGRMFTVLLFFVVPAALLAVDVVIFSSNPIAVFACFAVMLIGALYLMSYRESFA